MLETLKLVLVTNLEDKHVRELYTLVIHEKGIMHEGSVAEKERALFIYTRRLATMSPDNGMLEDLSNLINKISKASENQISICTLSFKDCTYIVFFTIGNILFGILKNDRLTYSKMESLIQVYISKNLDVSACFRIENGSISAGF